MVTITEFSKDYLNIIKKFINRFDVQNGSALKFSSKPIDIPINIGAGFTTTGWCLSVSEALNNDPSFIKFLEYRNAYSKIISIDIKEQFYGACYNNYRNSWHSAILVFDENQTFVIDLTCGQFGNRYVNKFIWDFPTWEQTFRSPKCTHVITDKNDIPLTTFNNKQTLNLLDNIEYKFTDIKNKLFKILTNKNEANILAKFLVDDIDTINENLYHGVLTRFDLKTIKVINNILHNMRASVFMGDYYVLLEFENELEANKYIEKLNLCNFTTFQYIKIYDKKKHIERPLIKHNQKFYIEFEIKNPILGVDLLEVEDYILLPIGTKLDVKSKENPDISSGVFEGMQTNVIKFTL